jgi:ferrochelatase
MLLNMGGPDSIKAVREFLYNLFSDRDIIKLGPPFMQKPLAYMIAKKRAPKSSIYYEKIGGKSPITEITKNQADALKTRLDLSGIDAICKVGMRYFHPRTPDVVRELKKKGIDKILGLSLYPHYSSATSGTTLTDFRNACKKNNVEYMEIDRFPDNELYIDSLLETLDEGLNLLNHDRKTFVKDDKSVLLYSAHNLPKYMIENKDPYLEEINKTINSLEKKTGIKGILCFQSKSGPVEWLSPTTEEKLTELSGSNIKNILILPVSFVSDHVETLYEIDIAYKSKMKDAGINLVRTPSLNTNTKFIETLFYLVKEKLEVSGWLK